MASQKQKAAARKNIKKARAARVSSGSPRKSYRSRAKGMLGSLGAKLNLPEAVLFAVLGYEGGNILQGTGIPEYLYQKYPQFQQFVAGTGAADSGDAMNKIIGALTGAKAVYDGVIEKKVDKSDINVLIPYTIGSVFDKMKSSGSSSSPGRW